MEETLEQLDADIDSKFLEEFRALCKKYNRDFYFEPIIPKIARVDFTPIKI